MRKKYTIFPEKSVQTLLQYVRSIKKSKRARWQK